MCWFESCFSSYCAKVLATFGIMPDYTSQNPRMLQNEGFCQKKERLLPNLKTFKSRSSLWLDQCLGRGLCSLCTVLLSYFCKLIHFCVQRYSPKPAQDFYTALCFMCSFWVCWSVFKPIEANTCLLLYNWAVNVNRVITNLAQSVFLFSFFSPIWINSQRGILIRSHLWWKKSGPDFAAHFRT